VKDLSERGRGFRRRGAGPPAKCRCPICGYEVEHKPRTPCISLKCPKCGASLVRG